MKSVVITLLLLLTTIEASAQTVTYFHADGVLGGIASGPDGNLWFPTTTGIVKMTPGGDMTAYATAATISGRAAIIAGPDGRMWFTEPDQGRIGMISMASAISEVTLPNGLQPVSIASAGELGFVWFGADGVVGTVTPAGTVAYQRFPTFARPLDMAVARDGALWFVESPRDQVARVTSGGGIIGFEKPLAELPTNPPVCCGPVSVAPDGDAAVYLAFSQGDAIAKIAPDGTMTTIATSAKRPRILAMGADGKIWFATERSGSDPVRIGSVSPDGTPGVSVGLAPEIAEVLDLVAGQDGTIWATTSNRDLAIVRVNATAPAHRRTGRH